MNTYKTMDNSRKLILPIQHASQKKVRISTSNGPKSVGAGLLNDGVNSEYP